MNGPIIVMGPSGCGKSSLARLLAQALGRPFIEGDDLHPPANRERMARGEPLTDEDREPFLDAVAAALQPNPEAVASCSALKRVYRDRLRSHVGTITFIHPVVGRDELQRRVAQRRRHFMPSSLVSSQLAILEPLGPTEAGIELDGRKATAAQVAEAIERLDLLP